MIRFSSRSVLSCLALSAVLYAGAARAQVAAPEATGVDPAGSYTGGKFDLVDLSNGNLNLHIPLVSYKQKGKLSLSFSLNENTNIFQGNAVCDIQDDDCYEYYNAASDQFGPQIIFDQGMNLGGDGFQTAFAVSWGTNLGGQTTDSYTVNWMNVVDNRGGSHFLGFDSTSFPAPDYQGNSTILMRANDGSGYTYATTPAVYSTGILTGTLTNADGVSVPYPPVNYPDIDMTDPNGNAIHTASGPDPVTGQQEMLYQDSAGRTIPEPPSYPSNSYGDFVPGPTTDCPDLGDAAEPALAEQTWWLPGNSTTGYVPYHICYTSITYRTEFFGTGSPVYTGDPYATDPELTGSDAETTNLKYDAASGAYPIQSIVLPDGSYWGFDYYTSGLNPPVGEGASWPVSYGELKKVILPTGGSIEYHYNNQMVCSLPDEDPWLRQNHVVDKRIVDDNNGNVGTWTYSGSFGGAATVTDSMGNDAVHSFSSLPNGNCAMYEYDAKQYQGSASTGNVLQETKTDYWYITSPQTYYFSDADHQTNVQTKSVTVLRNGSPYSTTSYTYPLLFENVQPYYTILGQDNTLSAAYPVHSNQPSEVTVAGAQGEMLKDVKTTYQWQYKASYLAANLLNLHYEDTTNGPSLYGENAIYNGAQTQYCYDESDGNCSDDGANGVLGNQTSVHRNLGGSWIQTSSATYNAGGMPITATDAKSNTTHFNYDGSGVYLSSVQPPTTSGISHTNTYCFQDATGLLLSQTDPNGVITNYTYDPIGRLTSVDSAAGVFEEEAWTKYSYPNPNEMDSAQDENTTGDGALVSKVLYDGLARPIHKIQPNGATADLTYNLDGQLASTSNPYFSTSDPTYGLTSYNYDALGRMTGRQHQPEYSYETWTYNGEETTYQDPTFSYFAWYTNAAGQLYEYLEPNSSDTPTIPTTYQYDVNGNLASATQQGISGETPRTRTFYYDSLSRLTSAINPETGTVSYSYDNNGNVTSKTDARGIVTNYTYDALNRLLGKSYTNDPANTPSTSYLWDALDGAAAETTQWGDNAIGHLTQAVTSIGGNVGYEQVSDGWDPQGRNFGWEACPGTSSLGCGYDYSPRLGDANWDYDLAGHYEDIDSVLSSAGGETAIDSQYNYNNGANLQSALVYLRNQNPLDPSTADFTLFANPTYNAANEVTSANLSLTTSGQNPQIAVTRTYDDHTWISSETDTAAGAQTPFYQYGVSRNARGDLSYGGDTVVGAWSFFNDYVHRLDYAQNLQVGGYYNNLDMSYQYDSFGNRTAFFPTGTPAVPVPGQENIQYNANNQSTTESYDAAGNVIDDGANQYKYDAEGRLCAVNHYVTPTSLTGYQYDGMGNRLAKGTLTSFSCDVTANGFTATSYYIYGLEGQILAESDGSLNPIAFNSYIGNEVAATEDQNGNWRYSFHDWLGTKRIVTDASGNVQETCASLPFGDGLNCSGNTDPGGLHFTGKKHDIESGLDYFNARYYDENVGRFTSPDPLGGHLEDPQTLNKYVYVLNNPLALTDPTGLDFHLMGCGQTNTLNCQSNIVGTYDSMGVFSATVISSSDNGLQDQNGNTYSGTFDGSNVTFTGADGAKWNGSWIQGSNETDGITGGGPLSSNFNFSFYNHGSDQTLNFTFKYTEPMTEAFDELQNAGFTHWNTGDDIGFSEWRNDVAGRKSSHFLVWDPNWLEQHTMSPPSTLPQGPGPKGEGHVGEYYPTNPHHFFCDVVGLC